MLDIGHSYWVTVLHGGCNHSLYVVEDGFSDDWWSPIDTCSVLERANLMVDAALRDLEIFGYLIGRDIRYGSDNGLDLLAEGFALWKLLAVCELPEPLLGGVVSWRSDNLGGDPGGAVLARAWCALWKVKIRNGQTIGVNYTKRSGGGNPLVRDS